MPSSWQAMRWCRKREESTRSLPTPPKPLKFLSGFSGDAVEFVTAISVMNSATGKSLTAAQRSKIVFRSLQDSEIADYIRRYEVLKFAGAFDGDAVIRFADHVSGSYNFATGVALNDLISLLRVHGVEV